MNDYDDAPQSHRGLGHPFTSQRQRLVNRDERRQVDTGGKRAVTSINRGIMRAVQPERREHAPANVSVQPGKVDSSRSEEKLDSPGKLTKDQIIDIYRSSRDLSDFKLRLGLGPVTDDGLGRYLMSKGFTLPENEPETTRQQYDGPSVGPLHLPHDWRRRYIRTPVDDPLQYEMTEVVATAEGAAKMQRRVDLKEASERAGEALGAAAGGGGRGGASRAFIANARTAEGARPRTEPTNGVRANPWFGKTRPEPTVLDTSSPSVPTTSSPYRLDPSPEFASRGHVVWTSPQTIPERVAMMAAMSGEGTVIQRGPWGDPRYQEKGWVKMGYLVYTADGNKIEIHYMRNTITERTDQFKFVSRGKYEPPKPDPKVSPGDRPKDL